MRITFWSENLKEIDPDYLEDFGIDGTILIKRIIKKYGGRV
jgi:hypothetical protein